MKNIQLSTQKAREIYNAPNTTPEFKKLLEQNFTKEELSSSIIERVTSYSEVFKEYTEKYGEGNLPYPYSMNKQERSINATFMIQIIAKVLNEGWEPDFNNTSEYKWSPWFKKTPSGWVFDYSHYHYCIAFFGFGLYFKTRELSDHAAKYFFEVYKDHLPE